MILNSNSPSLEFSNSLVSLCLCLDVGEFVEADEIVARIETDKVTVDILS